MGKLSHQYVSSSSIKVLPVDVFLLQARHEMLSADCPAWRTVTHRASCHRCFSEFPCWDGGCCCSRPDLVSESQLPIIPPVDDGARVMATTVVLEPPPDLRQAQPIAAAATKPPRRCTRGNGQFPRTPADVNKRWTKEDGYNGCASHLRAALPSFRNP